MNDQLAIPHVILLDVRPLTQASQLHQRRPRVVLVLGAHEFRVVGGGDQSEFAQDHAILLPLYAQMTEKDQVTVADACEIGPGCSLPRHSKRRP